MNYLVYGNKKEGEPMRAACFMSGSGTNVRKIIEHQYELRNERGYFPYEVVVIFSDRWNSKATEIGKDYDIPVITRDIESFYEKRGKKKWYFLQRPDLDAGTREEFDRQAMQALRTFEPDLFALCGYMSACSKVLTNTWPGINVHPADLSIVENGRRKFTGAYAVRDAILAGEKSIRATVHRVREQVDYGEILMISKPVEVKLPENVTLEDLRKPENKNVLEELANEHQERLKEVGDWEIFPKTIEWIADSRFVVDDRRNVYVDGKLMPNGYRL